MILALDELAERGDELADGLLNYICTNEFVFVLLLMRDILPVMANVNAAWQANNCDFVKVQKELKSTVSFLEQLRDAPDEVEDPKRSTFEFHQFATFKQALFDSAGIVLKTTRHYARLCVQNIRRTVCDNLIQQQNARFPEMDLLSHMSVLFNCHSYPATYVALSALDSNHLSFGEESLLFVLMFYAESASISSRFEHDFTCMGGNEWRMVRSWFWERRQQKVTRSFTRHVDFDENQNVLKERKS